MLTYEKEVLGFYVTSNPLSKHAEMISVYSTSNTSQLSAKQEGREVVIGGMITKDSQHGHQERQKCRREDGGL